MAETKYRAAVIGCGGRCPAHVKAYERIENAEVVACCDLVAEKRDKRAEEFGIKAYGDAAEMLAAEKPDIVHITTQPTARVDLMTTVSQGRVPLCTVEKPIATGVRDWRSLCELEAKSGTKFAVCHQFRWHENLVRCREALASGKLGEVKFLEFSAGMNISGQGTHILNYGMSLNGDSPVARVFGAAAGASDTGGMHPAPKHTLGYLLFENGVRAMWNNGPTAPVTGDPKTDYQHVRAAAHADKGRVLWEEFGRWEIVGPDGRESGDCGDTDTVRASNQAAQAAFHNAMFTWLGDDAKPAGTNLAQSLHEWKVVLALYAGALWRRPVELADFDPPEDLFEQLLEALAD